MGKQKKEYGVTKLALLAWIAMMMQVQEAVIVQDYFCFTKRITEWVCVQENVRQFDNNIFHDLLGQMYDLLGQMYDVEAYSKVITINDNSSNRTKHI